MSKDYEREVAAAAKLCAACEHEDNGYGTCAFCGALRPDDENDNWEPPVRRARLQQTREVLSPTAHEPITGNMTSIDAANVFVFFMSQSAGLLYQIVGEKQLRGEFESCIEMSRARFGEKP